MIVQFPVFKFHPINLILTHLHITHYTKNSNVHEHDHFNLFLPIKIKENIINLLTF